MRRFLWSPAAVTPKTGRDKPVPYVADLGVRHEGASSAASSLEYDDLVLFHDGEDREELEFERMTRNV